MFFESRHPLGWHLCNSTLADAHAPLPVAWRARSLLDGVRVTIEAGQRQVAGICCGIADDGSLELRSEAEMDALIADDVKFVALLEANLPRQSHRAARRCVSEREPLDPSAI